MYKDQQVVAIIPARDEALSIGSVIEDIIALRNRDGSAMIDRIIVCDNASIDDTGNIARNHCAEVVSEAETGYGRACLAALKRIDFTDIVLFIDADASLKISESSALLAALDSGADLAIGFRVAELRQKHSMTLPQLFGNYLATALIRFIWSKNVTDLGPFRAIRYDALLLLDMQERRFGWTVEMQVKAIQHSLKMVEIPVHYRRRLGQSKISGTLRGVVGAGVGIISTIFKLAMNPPKKLLQPPRSDP